MMNAFRIFLMGIFITISGYTAVVVSNHGMGLLQVFFRDMAKMGWPGQFNLDFMCLLMLSGWLGVIIFPPSVLSWVSRASLAAHFFSAHIS